MRVDFLNVIQLGPLMLNFELLNFILSAFTGYLALKYRISMANVEASIGDKFVTALLLSFIVWKFSLIIFDPVSVIRNPLSLLYFNGGDKGLWLAIIISVIFLWIRSRKDGTSLWMNVDVISIGLIAGSGMFHLLLLMKDTSNILFHLLYISFMVGLLVFLNISKKAVGNPIALNQLVIWFSLGMIGIFFAEKGRAYWIFSFSLEQIFFFFIFIVAIFVGNTLEKKVAEEVD